jgi:hypothetical protein
MRPADEKALFSFNTGATFVAPEKREIPPPKITITISYRQVQKN